MRVFVCEFITGGGLSGEPLPSRLVREGDMMLQAVLRDLLATDQVELVTTRDVRLGSMALPVGMESVSASTPVWDCWRCCIREVDAVLAIAPETHGVLERISRFVLAEDRLLLGSRPESIRVTASKMETARTLARYGIPAIVSSELDERLPKSTTGWVVKPDDGVGCENTFYFETRKDLDPWIRSSTQQGYIIQPFIAGVPASVSLLCRDGSARILACNRQLVEVAGGRIRYTGNAINALACHMSSLVPIITDTVCAFPGLWGYVGVDIILSGGGPVVVEINPRVTTAYVGLRQSIRQNPARLMLDLLADGEQAFGLPLTRRPTVVKLPAHHDK